jgi:hypothetical protein
VNINEKHQILLQRNHTGQSGKGQATVADNELGHSPLPTWTMASSGLLLQGQDQTKWDNQLYKMLDFTKVNTPIIKYISGRILMNKHFLGLIGRKYLAKQISLDLMLLLPLLARNLKTICKQSGTRIFLNLRIPRRRINHRNRLGSSLFRSKIRET